MKVQVDWRGWKGALLSLVLTGVTLIALNLIATRWLGWELFG